MPVRLFQTELAERALICILQTLEDPYGQDTRIKLLSDQTWRGKLPATFTFATIKQILHSVTWIFVDDLQFRLINGAKQPQDDLTLKEGHQDSRQSITIHCVLQLHGGGSENGTKTGYRTQVKNSFASILLEEGHDLAWTSSTVEQVMQKVGTKELSTILHQNHADKLKTALAIVKKCDIEVPKINPGRSSQIALHAKKKRQAVMPDPANYRALDGVLLNENGTNAQYVAKFGGHLHGYHMSTSHDAIPWLRQGEILSKDELALIVFGDLPIPTKLPHESVTVPCCDEKGRHVLIAGVLVQCGEKKIALQKGDGHKIDADGSILVAVTWWKNDWIKNWDEICSNPYKFLRAFPGIESILISVWGKSYRAGKTPTTPHEAESVQVHCLLKEDSFAPFLKLSGFNLLWLTPKTKEGKPHPNWKMIWLDPATDLQGATAIAAKLPESAGLVCQKKRHAIRVTKSSFEDCWKIIFPSIDPPEDIDTTLAYKLENLPFGVTSKMLTAWAQHNSWKLKPLRAVGPRSWLIGTGQQPPQGPLHFNGSPLLVRELKSRLLPAHPIVAGPKPSHAKSLQFDQMSNAQLIGDPWASYSGSSATKSVASNQATVTGNQAAVMGPTEQKFAQQADRIQKLEAVVQQIKESQEGQEHQIAEMHAANKERDVAIRAHIDDRVQSIKHDLDKSFAATVQQQTAQFHQNLEEIKNLLKSKPKRKSRTADQEDEDMSGS
eukprot:s475_g15.t1